MRKTLLGVFLALSIIVLSNLPVSAGQPIKVLVEGQPVSFDVKPVMEMGRILVPVRAIFEALGARVEWDDKTQTVYAERGAFYLQIEVDEVLADINGYQEELDVPARLINGRVLVPLRFAAEAFGTVVKWDDKTSTVSIYEKEPAGYELSDLNQLGSLDLNENFYPHEFTLLSDGSCLVEGSEVAYDEESGASYSKYLNVYFYDAESDIMSQVCHEDTETEKYEAWFTYRLPNDRIVIERYLETDGKVQTILFDFNPRTKEMKELITVPDNFLKDISSLGEIAYQAEADDQYDLYKVNLQGEKTRLTNTPKINETIPTWSPDGKKIAFFAVPTDSKQSPYLVIINAEGGERVNLKYPISPNLAFYWSPNSQFIAYEREEYFPSDPSTNGIWIVKVDGTSGRLIPHSTNMISCFWSPDSSKYCVGVKDKAAGQYRFIIMNRDGTGMLQPVKWFGRPAWSPDGNILLYDRYGEIWIWDLKDDKANRLLYGEIDLIKWSPDQKEVYLCRRNIIWKARVVPEK